MEIRVHKLLIMVGEEGAHHDVRDFKKLTDIIIEECLTGTNKPDDPADTFANVPADRFSISRACWCA